MDNPIVMIIAGLLAGVVSGMGIGGGSLLIIVLVSFFGVEQILAQGINLLYFLPTAAAAIVIHIKNKQIDWRAALGAGIPGMIIAAIAGIIAVQIDQKWLKMAFAVLVFCTGLLELFKKDPGEDKKSQKVENEKLQENKKIT